MIVRKIRGQEKVKVMIGPLDVEMANKLGIPIKTYIDHRIVFIAKERRWKWYFNKEKANESKG